MNKHTEITVTYKIPIREALTALGIPQPPKEARITAHTMSGPTLDIVVTEIAFEDTQPGEATP